MFSIIIPTFNNLEYLKLCIESIKKNSQIDHELIFHINDGSDGTLNYIKENKFKHTYSNQNIGLCKAVNNSAKLASQKYIVYAHDDMYFCPGWDVSLINEIKKINHDNFFLSGTLIESNSGHIKFDCGDKISNFDEDKLLNNYKSKNFYDYQGSHYAPHIVTRKVWEKVGGFSEEFNPGVGSDPDFNMKLWSKGIRIFKGINSCKVYHFVSVVTERINIPSKNKMNIRSKAHKIFLLKWGISIKFFKKFYLKTNSKYSGPLTIPKKDPIYLFNLLLCKFHYIYTKLIYDNLYKKN